FVNYWIEAVLMTDLYDKFRMCFRCLHHLVALFYGVSHRLFNKDVFACVERRHRDFCMKVKRYGNRHSVYFFALDHFSIIGEGLWLAAREFNTFLQIQLKDVAYRGDSGVWHLGEIAN